MQKNVPFASEKEQKIDAFHFSVNIRQTLIKRYEYFLFLILYSGLFITLLFNKDLSTLKQP